MELYEKKTWKRTEILRHLREQIKEKKPILMGAAGIGLVAKMEANAGIDLIMTTSADRFEWMDSLLQSVIWHVGMQMMW